MSGPSSSAGLQRIRAFTITAEDIEACARAYVEWFGYSMSELSTVPASVARLWGAPRVAGLPQVLLRPPGQSEVVVRLVQQSTVPGYAPLRTAGWNAMEVLVADPYELAVRLAGSPFRVVVPPRPLPFDADIHAMQVIGPANELLYMTALPVNRTILDLRPARTPVDQPFIAVLGAADLDDVLPFYSGRLHTRTIAPAPVIVRIVNEAYGLADENAIRMGIVKLPKDYLIEADEYPPQVRPRPRRDGELPPGIAMLTFVAGDLEALDVPWRHAPQVLAGSPYDGRRAGVTVGAAGEWIELLEA